MKIKKNLEPIVSGISAAIVISILAFLTLRTSAGVLLMFSFGATVFLVFVLYNLETAQPKNVFFGPKLELMNRCSPESICSTKNYFFSIIFK